jgi:endonuclease/exonuclease/phosphatase family metal-dependent hydrolase
MMYRFIKNASLTVLVGLCLVSGSLAQEKASIKVMTRNMYAGTDLMRVFAATDMPSFAQAMAATYKEVQECKIPERAARLADEILQQQPDLIALQEVTLWRTGRILSPPATDVLFDHLQSLLDELKKRKLNYGVVAAQTMIDAEAPIPTANLDLRITDRDVILARIDLPQQVFDLRNVITYRYQNRFVAGSPVLGQIPVYRGWMSVDATIRGLDVRFVNTHLETPYPGTTAGEEVQMKQIEELLGYLKWAEYAVVLAGDFNCNAEPGQDHFKTVDSILAAGYADTWKEAHPNEAGFTWPLFIEDQAGMTVQPNERIDLIFAKRMKVAASERVGMERSSAGVWMSDHAGVVATLTVP